MVSTESFPAADALVHVSLVTLFTFYLTISTRQQELYSGEHRVVWTFTNSRGRCYATH